MKTLLRGGSVVSGRGMARLDVLLEGERIAAVGENLPAGDAQAVDCAGRLLFPGFIDAHTHFDLEVAGTITADDFASGSRAALRGGTTTVIDFAAPDKGESLASGLARRRREAEKSDHRQGLPGFCAGPRHGALPGAHALAHKPAGGGSGAGAASGRI